MTVELNKEGAWVVSDMVDGYLVQKVYYYHTKQEAMEHFERTKHGEENKKTDKQILEEWECLLTATGADKVSK